MTECGGVLETILVAALIAVEVSVVICCVLLITLFFKRDF
jgi:hypothetical protein